MRAIDHGIMVCLECEQLNFQYAGKNKHNCTRCGAQVYARKPNSVARTFALLITSALLYIPANLLPIMTVNALGKGTPDTILSGVVTLIQFGMWPIAAVVFIASILVPTFKLVGLGLLLYSMQRRVSLAPNQCLLMFRFIEWIGRWSMLDIFVIAILVALVNFGQLASIGAGPGAIAFAGVVVLTMFAALSFDPRLIWDAQTDENV
ncbi:paraquat-inducible protein A [Pseudomonas sp. NPDC098747]|uniref:paraquat-inducible protein A n=1 Tax=Pseudomonas sp. NPDC098747 TaxID=3364487 RepID=UPI00383A4D38